MTDTTNPDTRPPASADPAIAGALQTIQQIDGLGEAAYLQNGAVLFTEAAARAAVAEAVTNRLRLIVDLLNMPVTPAMIGTPYRTSMGLQDERNRLLQQITGGTHAEA